MAIEISNALQAMGYINAANPPVVKYAIGWNQASLVRHGAGDYSITLDAPLDAFQSGFDACVINGAASNITVALENVDDSEKRIRLTNAATGVLTDVDFVFKFWKIPGA